MISPEEYVANLNSQLQWSDIWFYDAAIWPVKGLPVIT